MHLTHTHTYIRLFITNNLRTLYFLYSHDYNSQYLYCHLKRIKLETSMQQPRLINLKGNRRR